MKFSTVFTLFLPHQAKQSSIFIPDLLFRFDFFSAEIMSEVKTLDPNSKDLSSGNGNCNAKPFKIFIGYDPREDLAYEVCRYSLLKRSSIPIEIIPMKQHELRKNGVYWRERGKLESTEFSFSRFLTPFLANYEGWAMFVDCDFLYLNDIKKLVDLIDEKYAIMCVQHDYTPKETTKMDGAVQTVYPRKNWSSMVLYNCGHLKNRILTPDVVNKESGAFLHRFQWLGDDEIGEWSFALDWLLHSDVSGIAAQNNHAIAKDDTTPIVIMIPGLTSDSSSPYLKHLVFNTAKNGWNVVVSNHRGLGGVSVTSDCFYNAGWTEDARQVINYLHQEYSAAPLFVVGTSIGANILVKYLGEDGENVPIAGAAAVSCPWDLLIGSRFISRRLIQKLYNRALTIGLQGYAQLHETRYSRLANWEGIKKSRSIRDFDTHATCLVGNYETVDTYYRGCSSAAFIGRVSVPLLCISALDDPLCTREAIPWDECRANKNVVLATTQHGGHLAFFEGIAGSRLWWVTAVNEYLGVLLSSSLMHTQKKEENVGPHSAIIQSSIDQGPYLNVADGMVAAMGNERTGGVTNEPSEEENNHDHDHDRTNQIGLVSENNHAFTSGREKSYFRASDNGDCSKGGSSFVERCLYQLARQNNKSIWLLAFIAIVSSWPVVGAALGFLFKRKLKKALPGKVLK